MLLPGLEFRCHRDSAVSTASDRGTLIYRLPFRQQRAFEKPFAWETVSWLRVFVSQKRSAEHAAMSIVPLPDGVFNSPERLSDDLRFGQVRRLAAMKRTNGGAWTCIDLSDQ